MEMKKLMIFLAIGSICFFLALSACSKEKDVESQKVSIDKATEQTAENVRKSLRAPLEKAQTTRDLGDERTRAVDEAVKQQ